MLAGTRTERTIVASIKTATASPKPTCWSITSRPAANPPKTATMIRAAPVMIRAVDWRPTATDSLLRFVCVVVLLDPAEQEDVVVHAQAEQDREEEDRDPGLDRRGLLEAEQIRADTLLEDQDHQAVGRTHGKQVEDDRLERQDDRAEDDHQEQEAQAEDEGEDDRRVSAGQVEEVGVEGGVAGDRDSRRLLPPKTAGTMLSRSRSTSSKAASSFGLTVRVASTRATSPFSLQRGAGDVAVHARFGQGCGQRVDLTTDLVLGAFDHDLDRGEATGGEVLAQDLEGPAGVAFRQRFDPSKSGVDVDERGGGGQEQDDGATTATIGRAMTTLVTRPQKPAWMVSWSYWFCRAAVAASYVRRRGQSILSPRRARTAGIRVSVAATATITTRIAPTASERKMVVGTRNMPRSAKMTVTPEKKTALLAVAPANSIASSFGRPRRRSSR